MPAKLVETFEERRKQPRYKHKPLSVRLTPAEHQIIDEAGKRMGGATKTAVITEALRLFLPAVAKSGAFVHTGGTAKDKSAHSMRKFLIRQDIADGLEMLVARHGWTKIELVRQALRSLAARYGISAEAEEPDDTRPRAPRS